MTGQYKGSTGSVISLDAYNVPPGSVVVTAGGVTLTEGTDYSVDYSAGEVTILNQSIDHPQPEHHRCRHERERVVGVEHQLRHAT